MGAPAIADHYHYSYNNGSECLYYHGKHMHSLAIKAREGIEHKGKKNQGEEKKHKEQKE